MIFSEFQMPSASLTCNLTQYWIREFFWIFFFQRKGSQWHDPREEHIHEYNDNSTEVLLLQNCFVWYKDHAHRAILTIERLNSNIYIYRFELEEVPSRTNVT